MIKFGCYEYIEDKDIDETIELIIDTYNSFWEERSFYRYTLETTLYSFLGDSKRKIDSYYDYAKKVNSKTKNDEVITEEEIDNKRKQAEKLEKELKEGGEWVSE